MVATPLDSPLTSTGVTRFSWRAVTQLANIVSPPALDPTCGSHSAGVFHSRGDGSDTAGQAGNVHRRQAQRLRAVAQLAKVVPSPALDPTGGDQGAGVAISHGEGIEGPAHGDGGDPAGQTGNVYWCIAVIARTVARDTPPALDPARGSQSTGVVRSRGDGGHPAGQPGDVHRRKAVLVVVPSPSWP